MPVCNQPCVQAVIRTRDRCAVRVDDAPAQGAGVGFAISISAVSGRVQDKGSLARLPCICVPS